VLKVEVVKLPATNAMHYGANFVHSGFVFINAHKLKLAHSLLRTFSRPRHTPSRNSTARRNMAIRDDYFSPPRLFRAHAPLPHVHSAAQHSLDQLAAAPRPIMTNTRMRMMWIDGEDTGFRYAKASDDSDGNDDASDENGEAGDDDGDAGGDDDGDGPHTCRMSSVPASSGVCTGCPLAMTCRPGACQRRSVVVCAL